jgi:hypothetical protein
VRGVNVLRTIGVAVPVRVMGGVKLTCRGSEVETVPVGDPAPDVANGKTSSSGSDPKICAIKTQIKTVRPSTINNASSNDRFSRSTFRKFIFTLTALLIGLLPAPVAALAAG